MLGIERGTLWKKRKKTMAWDDNNEDSENSNFDNIDFADI